jgi:hypothetical protein
MPNPSVFRLPIKVKSMVQLGLRVVEVTFATGFATEFHATFRTGIFAQAS